jgi:tetratricopeptide (TPR) repeat protein
MDNYGIAHLTSHLARANKLNSLYNLVTNPKWRRISERFDVSRRSYSIDIDIAFQAIEDAVHTHEEENEAQKLAWLASLALVSAKQGQEASRLSPQILETIARTEGVMQAINRSAVIPDTNERAECMIWIGFVAHQSGEVQMAADIWEQAHQLLSTQQFDYWMENLEIISELITVAVRAGELHTAQNWYQKYTQLAQVTIEKTGGTTSTVRLARIKAALAVGLPVDAQALINEIDDSKDRGKAFLDASEFQHTLPISQNDQLVSHYEAYTQTKVDQTQLATVLVGGGWFERGRSLLVEPPDPATEAWVLRAYIAYLFKSNLSREAQPYIEQTLMLIQSIPDSTARFSHCARFILGRQRDSTGIVFSDLLPIMQQDFDQVSTQLESRTVELAALAFSLLGDTTRATAALTLHPVDQFQTDDWEETNTFIKIADALGKARENSRLAQMFTIATRRQDRWHTAETLLALATHACIPEVTKALEVLWEDSAVQQERPNVIGALAVWRYRLSGNLEELRATLDRATSLLQTSGDRADGLAYLALTLAQNGLGHLADVVITDAFTILKGENDENTIARVCGTLADVAVQSNQPSILDQLEGIIVKIEDEPWLQAEALLWIAAGYARFGKKEKAQTLFMLGMELASWTEIESKIINNSWCSQSDAENFLATTGQIGWRSTQAAAIFAWIAVLVLESSPWNTKVGLAFIQQLPEEYSAKRADCIQMLAVAQIQVFNDPRALLGLFTDGLRYSKQRDPGEVWAVIGGCFDVMAAHFGLKFVIAIWDSMVTSLQLFGSGPTSITET